MALVARPLSRAGPWCSNILDLQVAKHGGDARVITVGGEINALTAPELAALVTAQVAAVPLVVVDLQRVRFIGFAGLSVLVEANEFATQEGHRLRLVCHHSEMVNRALDVAGLREQFNLSDTVSAALNNSP
ncbi:MAG TPA: anti-sigma factor antagonist [Pseudonocardiaceae bacterium]|nr:anti-sigma factor antagonist [Pseudonocardiaceae bacterium]